MWTYAKIFAKSVSLNKEKRDEKKTKLKVKLFIISCSVRSPQPGCTRIPPDPAKNYPDCCGMIQCAPVKIDY